MTKLPAAMPGHWDTPEGHEIAVDYLAKERSALAMGDLSDFHLANKQYLEEINVGPVIIHSSIGVQTAAKERIRWLSARLAAATAENPMRTLLREMFTGWILYEKSWDANTSEYTRQREDCFIEAAGGDYNRGLMLGLFDYWANDIQSLAPHFGLNLERCFAGELYINEDIPPAPAADYWWRDGQWFAPGALDEDSSTDPAAVHSIAVAAPRGEISDQSKPGYLKEGGE